MKRIVYLKEKAYEEGKEQDIRNLFEKLSKCDIETEISEIGIMAEAAEVNQIVIDQKNRDTLYITDSPFCQKIALANKLPLLLYLHEGNRNRNFLPAAFAIEQIEEIEYESLLQAYQRLVGEPWHILSTDRCIIRETTTEDLDEFYEIYSEPSITRYMEDLYEDREKERAYIEDYIKKVYGFYGYGMWTVLNKENNAIIGRAGLSWREGFDIPEIGFVIAVPYQGKGYAYEVCKAVLEYGKRELGFTQIQALIMEGNIISENLCRKLGFRYLDKVMIEGNAHSRMLHEDL